MYKPKAKTLIKEKNDNTVSLHDNKDDKNVCDTKGSCE